MENTIKSIIPQKSAAEKLAGIKSIFTQALEQAQNLSNEIKEQIDEKDLKIAELQESINSLQAIQEETNKFSTTIKSLVS
jgi:DNA repair ATPase RecN